MLKRLAAFVFVLLALVWAQAALAQSSPGLVFGQVPTAAQWNSYFAAKQDYLGFAPLNPSSVVGSSPITASFGGGVLTIACPTCATTSNFANPTGSVGTIAVNGVATTSMRSDAAPPLSSALQAALTGTNHAVLLGTGALGFNSAAPSTAGVALVSNGASADPSFNASYGLRKRLTTGLRLKVDFALGTDNATCGESTGAGACKQISYALTRYCNDYDLAGQTGPGIDVADNDNYTAVITCDLVGLYRADNFTIVGNTTTPGNVKVSGSPPITAINTHSDIWFRGMRVIPSGNQPGMLVDINSLIKFDHIEFAAPGALSHDILVEYGAKAEAEGDYTILTGTRFSHVFGVWNRAGFLCNPVFVATGGSCTVTLSASGGSPQFTGAYYYLQDASFIVTNFIYSGSVSGTSPHYNCSYGSNLNAGGAAASIPGNAANTVSTFCIVDGGATNSVPLTYLAQVEANTSLSNWTGSTANVVANAMPSCPDSGGNHLNYVSGTGVTCGTGGTLKTGKIDATRNMTAATGSVAYTGCGFRPTALLTIAAVSGSTGGNIGFVTSALAGRSQVYTNTVFALAPDQVAFEYTDNTGTNSQKATISSFDADGFTASWTKLNSPTGTLTMYVLCLQ